VEEAHNRLSGVERAGHGRLGALQIEGRMLQFNLCDLLRARTDGKICRRSTVTKQAGAGVVAISGSLAILSSAQHGCCRISVAIARSTYA
jgi:hypothetical protein